MKTSESPTSYSAARLVILIYALLTIAATDNDRAPEKVTNDLLEQDIIIKSMANKKREMHEQRNSSVGNTTQYCSDAHLSSVISNLHPSCLDSITHLNVGSPSYTSSMEGIMDINNVCRDDCAGAFIMFGDLCPNDLPTFHVYLRGICSMNSNSELCGFSVEHNNGSRVYQKCYVETNAFVRCRNRCKNSLIRFMDDIGCCINTFYNDTQTIIPIFPPTLNSSVDPLLWEACGLPYPHECLHGSQSPSPTSSIINTPISTQVTPSPTFQPPGLICSEATTLSPTCINLLTAFENPTDLQLIAEDLGNTSSLCSNDCAGSYINPVH